MRRVIATDFAVWPAAKDVHLPAEAMVAASDHWARLANYLLTYDQVIIPTGNFHVVAVLRRMLGEDIFDELLKTKAIVFARFDEWIGYTGGQGLIVFKVSPDPTTPPDGRLATSFFRPVEEAIYTALDGTFPRNTWPRRKELHGLILGNVVTLPRSSIFEGLDKETYADIQESSILRDQMAIRNSGRPLSNLKGSSNDTITIFNPHFPNPDKRRIEVWTVLRVAFENFLLRMTREVGATDLTGDADTLSVIRAKGQRVGLPSEGAKAFARIQSIEGVPNLGQAFATKLLTADDLLRLRYSPNGEAFRNWFAANGPAATADEVVRRFVEDLNKPSWLNSLPARALRLALTTGVGILDPTAGIAASVADLGISEIHSKSPSRLFLEDAKVLVLQKERVERPASTTQRRNQPCYCGSGKKYKHCHGA